MSRPEEKAVRVTIAAAFALVVIFAAFLYIRQPGREQQQEQQAQDASLIAQVQTTSPATGNANATIVMAEFSDFQCPYCKLVAPLLDRAASEYGDKIRRVWIFTTNPDHPQSESAAVAAYCSHKQGQFWQYRTQLFEAQDNLGPATYNQVADAVDLDMSLFRACLSDSASVAVVRAHSQFAQRAGVTATPYVTINSLVLNEAFTWEQLKSAIDQNL